MKFHELMKCNDPPGSLQRERTPKPAKSQVYEVFAVRPPPPLPQNSSQQLNPWLVTRMTVAAIFKRRLAHAFVKKLNKVSNRTKPGQRCHFRHGIRRFEEQSLGAFESNQLDFLENCPANRFPKPLFE